MSIKPKYYLISVFLLLLISGGLFYGGVRQGVLAGDEACTNPSYPVCWDYYSVNQHACTTCEDQGADWKYVCLNKANPCGWNCGQAVPDDDLCNTCIEWDPYDGNCVDHANDGICAKRCCNFTTPVNELCTPFDEDMVCNTTTIDATHGYCLWQGTGTYCEWSEAECIEIPEDWVYSCCGPGEVTPTPTPEPGVTPTPTPTPTPVPVCRSPLCDIDNRPGDVCVDTDVSFTADASDPENNLSSMELLKASVALGDWSQFANFTSTGGALTDRVGTTQFNSEGRYYVSCNAYDSAGCRCSGNPWCPWEPLAVYGSDCDGWTDCDPNGLDWQEVTAYERPLAPVNTTRPGLYCDVNSVTLTWNPIAAATRNTIYPYRVDVAPDSWDGSCSSPDYCNNTNAATAVAWPVTNCSMYDLWVHAVEGSYPDACEWSNGSNEVRFWTDNTPLSAPTGIAPTTGICITTPTFTWNATADCSRNLRYDIRVDDRTNPWNGSCIAPNPGDFCVNAVYGTSYTVGTRGEAALIPGHTYAWWIHATTDCGTSPAAAAIFNVLGAPTGATNLTEVFSCGVGTAVVNFSWTPVTLINGYPVAFRA